VTTEEVGKIRWDCSEEPDILSASFDGIRARSGNLAILCASATRNSDRPDKLAVHDDRDTAVNRNCARERQQAKTLYVAARASDWRTSLQ
jgi:hypothetical protein